MANTDELQREKRRLLKIVKETNEKIRIINKLLAEQKAVKEKVSQEDIDTFNNNKKAFHNIRLRTPPSSFQLQVTNKHGVRESKSFTSLAEAVAYRDSTIHQK